MTALITRADVIVHSRDNGLAGTGTGWHVQVGRDHYVISCAYGETLTFPADTAGEITSYLEITDASGMDVDHETAISWLLESINSESRE